MGGYDDIRERQQSCRDRGFQNIILTILKYIICFFLIHIQTDTKEFLISISRDQILRLDQCASRCIYKDHIILHLIDRLCADHMVRIICQRTVKGDQITGR